MLLRRNGVLYTILKMGFLLGSSSREVYGTNSCGTDSRWFQDSCQCQPSPGICQVCCTPTHTRTHTHTHTHTHTDASSLLNDITMSVHRLYSMFMMVGCVQEELNAMKQGLNDVIPNDLLAGLNAEVGVSLWLYIIEWCSGSCMIESLRVTKGV